MFARVSDWSKGTWLAVLVLSIWAAWPVGLAVFLFLVGTGRLQAWADEMTGPGGLGAGMWSGLRSMAGTASRFTPPPTRPSGNDAFDSYRRAELERLEEEEREFKAFLERLRRARDKAEFDQFMAERRRPVPTPHREAGQDR